MCNTKVNYASLGQRIRALRQRNNITVAEWPKLKSGVTVNRLSQIERAVGEPCTLDEIGKIATTLNIEPSSLLDWFNPCCKQFDTCEKACVILVKHLRSCLLNQGGVK